MTVSKMYKTFFHPVFQVSIALRKSLFQDKMSNYTLLKTPFGNIPNRELITRVESSQIRQGLYEFGQTYRYQKFIKETLSDFKYEMDQLIHFLTTDVMKWLRMRNFFDMTVLRQLCVQNASPLFAHPLTTHSIFTTLPVGYLI